MTCPTLKSSTSGTQSCGKTGVSHVTPNTGTTQSVLSSVVLLVVVASPSCSLKEDKGGFSPNFPEKQVKETVKTDSAFVSDSQALLNCSCCNTSEMCYHFPLYLSGPAKAKTWICQRLEEQSSSCACEVWTSVSTLKGTQSCTCDFSCGCSEEKGGCSCITQVSS